jgi:hypothetical protein
MSLWKRVLVALTTATLIYGGQLRVFSNDRNRFYYFWDQRDAAALVVGIIALALAGLCVGEGIQRLRRPWLTRLALHGFLAVFAVGVLSWFTGTADWKTELVLLGVAVFLTWSWCSPQRRIAERAAVATLAVSPLFAISWVQVLRYPSWATPVEARPAPKPLDANGHPVFVFIFDEWSFFRSTDRNGDLLPFFKNLRQFREQSFYFTEARSAGVHTRVSIPGLCFQTTRQYQVGPGSTWFADEGVKKPTSQEPSIFTAARARGYETRLLGFYLPYRRIFGDSIDYCESTSRYVKPESFAKYVGLRMMANLQFLPDPISRKLEAKRRTLAIWRKQESEHWRELHERLRPHIRQLMRTAADQSLTFVHFPCPHFPYIYDEEGRYAGPFAGSVDNPYDPAAYMRHLHYADVLAGEFLRELKAEGRFDRSMIIFTSDHSWRKDNRGGVMNTDETRHVPMMIKFPGQKQPYRVEERFPATRLQPLLEAGMTGKASEAECLELIRKYAGPDG